MVRVESIRTSEHLVPIAPLGSWNWNILTGDLWWSDEVYRIFGLEPREFGASYEAFLGCVHPEDRPLVEEAVDRAVASGTSYRIEHRIVRPDGTERIVHEQGEIGFGADGRPAQMVGAVLDITERMEAERELAARARKQAALVELTHLALANPDPQALMDAIVELAARTLDVEYCKVLELLPTGEALLLRAGVGWREGLVGHATVGSELDSQAGFTLLAAEPVVVADLRSETRFSGPPLLREHGVISGMSCVIANEEGPFGVLGAHTTRRRDFSENEVRFLQTIANLLSTALRRRHIEDALAEREESLRMLVEQVPAALFALDLDLRYTLSIGAGLAGLGLAPGELVGVSAPELLEREGVEHLAHLRRARDGTSLAYEWVSGDRTYHTHLEPLRDAHGQITGVLGLIHDISELKSAEDALRRLTDELEQRVAERTTELRAANEELEAFSYSVSHDLRAPLRAMEGFSMALVEDCAEQLDDTGRGYVARIRAAAERMGGLIDDILQLSRVGRAEMRSERVDLAPLARAVVEELRAGDPDRHVEVAIPDELEAQGDPQLLRVVLENLLGNAWKFTGAGREAHIEVGAERRDGEPAFFVRDDGVGFDMAYADKLFTPFQRLHGADEFPGSGIGLATVRRIVHRHGGHVWAEGEVDRGATFHFTLGKGTP